MKKMASILLIVLFALAVIGRLSSFFDRVQYQGISQDPSYRSLQVEQKLTPEKLEEYGVLPVSYTHLLLDDDRSAGDSSDL